MTQQMRDRLGPERKPAQAQTEARAETTPGRGPAGDARPDERDPDPRTKGSLPQEDVADRPVVSCVKPEDYPLDQRASGKAL